LKKRNETYFLIGSRLLELNETSLYQRIIFLRKKITMLQRLISWGNREDNIRAMLLVGSRALGKEVDALADYDVAIFSKTQSQYLNDTEWLIPFGQFWMIIREKIRFLGKTIPTRLIIFEGGVKVDFSFFPEDLLHRFIEKPSFDIQVLLDKDSSLSELHLSAQRKPKKLNEKAFHTNVEEFFFEAFHVAKYLRRGDLWSAQFRMGLMRDNFLLKMLEWKDGGVLHPHGKDMSSWVDETTWKEVCQVFSRCEKEDCWKALLNAISLFRRLGKELSYGLGFSYLAKLDEDVEKFILNLKNNDS
jgi:aminoglycoside 6-adenylyltransferase